SHCFHTWIMSCELGRLYNKDVVIEYLLVKSAERPNAEVVIVRGYAHSEDKFLFYFISSPKEVKTEICHKCGYPFEDDDIIVLNGTKEEVEKQREKMEERRAKAKTKLFQTNLAELLPKLMLIRKIMMKIAIFLLVLNLSGFIIFFDLIVCLFFYHPVVAGLSGSSSSSKSSKSSTSSATKRSIQDLEEKSEAFKSLFTTHSSVIL
uniref:Uncharacterized protein n=1 Tax=Oryzias latipes TaxID=8090 RepID=A0A3P9HRG9_ORYLA